MPTLFLSLSNYSPVSSFVVEFTLSLSLSLYSSNFTNPLLPDDYLLLGNSGWLVVVVVYFLLSSLSKKKKKPN